MTVKDRLLLGAYENWLWGPIILTNLLKETNLSPINGLQDLLRAAAPVWTAGS